MGEADPVLVVHLVAETHVPGGQEVHLGSPEGWGHGGGLEVLVILGPGEGVHEEAAVHAGGARALSVAPRHPQVDQVLGQGGVHRGGLVQQHLGSVTCSSNIHCCPKTTEGIIWTLSLELTDSGVWATNLS